MAADVTENEAEKKLSPALEELLAGNRRFTSGRTSAYRRDLAMLQQTLEKQEPFAAVLSCSDSRVPVEVVFDQTIGQLFVTRVAGNMVTPEIVASLEYAAAVLGTNTILIMGHSRCGAVTAAIQRQAQPEQSFPGQIGMLFPHLKAAVDQAGPDVESTIRANALIQSTRLRELSPLLAAMIDEGKLQVATGYFDISSGAVTLLEGPEV
jgi:carbonic anhydrase